jgi:formylglycine-generating enzyme
MIDHKIHTSISGGILAIILFFCAASVVAQSTGQGTTNSVGMEFVRIPAGRFQMGGNTGKYVERPVRQVTLSAFEIATTEVTQRQWEQIMGHNPSHPDYGVGSSHPVTMVSWYDAVVYANRLSIVEGLEPAYRINGSTDPDRWGEVPSEPDSTWNAVEMNLNAEGYRLPTEAEWEYAARGGSRSRGYRYSGGDTADEVAWYRENSEGYTRPVGTRKPNELGLYDMSGNVWEWVWDRYPTGYPTDDEINPTGFYTGPGRVVRGGSWDRDATSVRSTYYGGGRPYGRTPVDGFRLIRRSEPILGAIRVTVETTGIVYLDGEQVDELEAGGSLSLDSLELGDRRVEVRYHDGKTESNMVSVDFDVEAEVSFRYVERPEVTTRKNSVGMTFVSVPAGRFLMGSAGGRDNERPIHEVTVRSFAIAATEVTQLQWETIMGGNPSDPRLGIGPEYPVNTVCWYDAIVYANTLSLSEGLEPVYAIGGSTDPVSWGEVPARDWSGEMPPTEEIINTWAAVTMSIDADGYRLPTEAEWEYAARGGPFSWGYDYSGSAVAGDVAWHGGWRGGNSRGRIHPVGTKEPNELWLYDMSGSVSEWVWDFMSSTYPSDAQQDPTGSPSGTSRVRRGGSWQGSTDEARTTRRISGDPRRRDNRTGFRLVRPAVR